MKLYPLGTPVTSGARWMTSGVVEVLSDSAGYQGVRSNVDGHLYWLYPDSEFKPKQASLPVRRNGTEA